MQNLVSRGLIFVLVLVICIVNIRREIAYETSVAYGQEQANSAIYWAHYVGTMGQITVAIDTPFGFAGEFAQLYAPEATICAAQWVGQWQHCPASSHVAIFAPGAGTDAARYASLTHLPVHEGASAYGQTLYWFVIPLPGQPLPDIATVLGHAAPQ